MSQKNILTILVGKKSSRQFFLYYSIYTFSRFQDNSIRKHRQQASTLTHVMCRDIDMPQDTKLDQIIS